MKKKLLFILTYVCLLSLALLGAVILLFTPKEARPSDGENRMLAAFPALGARELRSGAFMDGFEDYLSDAFPARDKLTDLSRRVLGLFGERDEDYAAQEAIAKAESLAMEENMTAQEPPIAEEPPAEAAVTPSPVPETPAPTVTPAPEEASEPVAETPAETAAPEATAAPAAPAKKAERDAEFWLVRTDGTRNVQETYSAEALSTIAPVLDEYRACLPEDGKVLFVNVPVSTYYFNVLTSAYSDWDSDVDEVLQPLVGEGVYIYDAADILRPYLFTEDLYPAGDHHWHAIAAWHMARAMTEDLGYPVTEFYEWKYKLEYEFHGSPYTPEQLQNMTIERQNRRYPVPVTPVESYILRYMTQRSPSVYLESDRFKGYGIYLGGRWRPWRLFETGYHTGRTALIIGDSFYHAFLPYMTTCYDRIISTDLRNDMYNPVVSGGSIRQYIEEYEVDDVYFLMCTYTSLNGYVYQELMEKYLNTDYGAIYGRGEG